MTEKFIITLFNRRDSGVQFTPQRLEIHLFQLSSLQWPQADSVYYIFLPFCSQSFRHFERFETSSPLSSSMASLGTSFGRSFSSFSTGELVVSFNVGNQ